MWGTTGVDRCGFVVNVLWVFGAVAHGGLPLWGLVLGSGFLVQCLMMGHRLWGLVLGVIWWFVVGLKWVVGCDLGFGLEVGFPVISIASSRRGQ